MNITKLSNLELFMGLVFILVFPNFATGENSKSTHQDNEVLVVDFTDYYLSVQAQNVDINDVFKEITLKTGVKIESETPINFTISIVFKKKGFTRGMKSIVSQIRPGEYEGKLHLGNTFEDSTYTIRKISAQEISTRREQAASLNAQGEKLLSEGKDYQAYHVFIKALRIDPKFLLAHKNLVRIYQQWEHYQKLSKRLEKVIDLDSEDPQNYKLLADAYRLDYQHDKAIENYNRFMSKTDDKIQIDNTKKIITQLQRREMRMYFQKISEARSLIEAKEYDQAIEVLNEAGDLEPSNPKAYELLAFTKEIKRNYSEAVELRKKIAKLAPDDARNLLFLGKDLRIVSKHDAALEYLRKAKDVSRSEYMQLLVEKELGELGKIMEHPK